MAGDSGDKSLEDTPTWAVATVCAVFVIISILIEHGIHSLGKWFQKRQNKAMIEALEKIKAELMLLGFISLLLTVGTKYVAKICIPKKYGDIMLPCAKNSEKKKGGDGYGDGDGGGGDAGRKLLSYAEDIIWHRVLATADLTKDYCGSKDKVSLISYSGVHQLHIFIFVLAVFHVLYSIIIMGLGVAKAHFAPNSKFDFHKYIKRSMEDDFKVVVGISIPLWIFAVIFLLLNVYNWYTLYWLSLLPLVILLLVGMKLELVIMEMAHQIQDRTTVVRGAPVVEPSNRFFWFNRPQWILYLIHFTLFQMGSHMKQAIFEEQTAKALKKWQKAAKERKKLRKAGGADANSGFMSGENTPSQGSSPVYLLRNYRSSTAAERESAPTSPMSYQSDTELSEIEFSNHGTENDARQPDLPQRNEEAHSVDFSFVKP
ncbi:hypothetical protein F0562_026927 [Nyssa sinensis]|uniref:MLO-like protein n=1 Tax=Nyssa sinensis TaxID=561372 RepID=A0A5J5B565_9ASTE|nr:hypothetical protein F0562_026927 [Nyssa sinensis]